MKPQVKDVINCYSVTHGEIRNAEVTYVGDAKIHMRNEYGTYVTRLSNLRSVVLIYRKVDDTDLGI